MFGGHLMIMAHGAQLECQAEGRDTGYVAFGMVVAENGFRIAAYDVLGTTGATQTGASPHRRARGITHTESFFVLPRTVRAGLRHGHRPVRHHLGLRPHPGWLIRVRHGPAAPPRRDTFG